MQFLNANFCKIQCWGNSLDVAKQRLPIAENNKIGCIAFSRDIDTDDILGEKAIKSGFGLKLRI